MHLPFLKELGADNILVCRQNWPTDLQTKPIYSTKWKSYHIWLKAAQLMFSWRRLYSLNHPGRCLFTGTVGANPLDRRRMPFLLCQILLTHDKSRGKACMRWERFSQMWHLFLTCWKLRLCPSQAVAIKHLCLFSFSWLLSLVSAACSVKYF